MNYSKINTNKKVFALSGKPLVFDHVNLALLAALLFGGTAGGVLSALGAVGNTAPEH